MCSDRRLDGPSPFNTGHIDLNIDCISTKLIILSDQYKRDRIDTLVYTLFALLT